MPPVERLPPPAPPVRAPVTPGPSRSITADTPFDLADASEDRPQGNLQTMQSGIAMPGLNTPLSLVDLEAIAFAHNPTLGQSAADINGANGRMLQATLAPNPIAGYQGQEIGNEGAIGQQGFFVNQEFVRRRKRRLARAVGSREVALAQQNAAIQQLKVLNDVRCEHFNVLIGERAEILAREVHVLSKKKLDKTKKLYEKQLVHYHDVLRARIQSHTAQIAVGNARNRYLAAWRRLASLLGTPTLAPRPLTGDLQPSGEPLQWDGIVQQIYARSPQLQRAYANVAWKQAMLAQTKSAMSPNLLSVIGLAQDTASNDLIGNVQLGVPLPLYNKNQGTIQEAYAELRKAELDVDRTKLAIRSRLAATYEIYRNSWNEVNEYTHHILPDARAALESVIRGYEDQEFDMLTVLEAERTFAKANLAYIKSLQDLGITKIAIEGSLLVGSLRENSQAVTPEMDVHFSPAFGPGVIPVETDPGG
ncbi:MAG: TolC family protein [Planctomycetota bacterium]|nr:TolC family protein [Planctomycetota bacterium]